MQTRFGRRCPICELHGSGASLLFVTLLINDGRAAAYLQVAADPSGRGSDAESEETSDEGKYRFPQEVP